MPFAMSVAFLTQGYVYDHVLSVRSALGELTPDEVRDVEHRCHGLLQIQRIHNHASPTGVIVVLDCHNSSQLFEI